MAIQTLQSNKSVYAILSESVEGTPVTPSAATDFIPVHEGATLAPSFDELENLEKTGNIGMAKTVLGLENPTASFDLYIKGSGVEGQEPHWGLLAQALLGSKTVNAVEYDLVGGSTTTVLPVDAGEGLAFYRGQALLVKDATNGYSVRNVLSVSTDNLNLAQALANAPALGTNLGKAVTYLPTDTGHPTITYWEYLANGGNIQMMSGARPTELSLTADAAQNIIGSFTMEGIKYYFNPITVTTGIWVDFDDGGGEENVSVAAKTYTTPQELADAIATAMNAATTDNITVTYSNTTGKFTIASDGVTLSLLWKTGVHGADNTDTHIGTLIGFSDAADDTGALTYTSDNAQVWSAAFTPDFDDTDPAVAKNNQVMFGTQNEIVCFESATIGITITNTKADILSVCAESGKSGTLFTERSNEITLTGYMTQHDASVFERFRNNTELKFTYNFGVKSGGNWLPGNVINFFFPKVKISSFEATDTDGVITFDLTIQPFVEDGLGEVYINQL